MPLSILSAADAVARADAARTYTAALRPVLIGPKAGLHRYAVADERAHLGAYDPSTGGTYDYPAKAADSAVDLDSVKLFAKTASLLYFTKTAGSGSSCQPSTAYPNRVRSAGHVFKTANGVARSSTFGDRDVKVGDLFEVSGSVSSVLYTATGTVTGFVGEAVAAVVGTATAAAGNRSSQSASVSVSQVAGTPVNDVVATASGASYESTADGYISRTYTVTVTTASTGNDATTGRLRVRSADGLDDQDDVVPSAFGSATAVGTKGLTVTFSIDGSHSSASVYGIDENDFVLGQQWTVSVAQLFTALSPTAGGTYTGAADDTLVVTVTRGGTIGGATAPLITATTASGADSSGPSEVLAASTAYAVGTKGVTVSFPAGKLRKGDAYLVELTAATEGAVRTLVLSHDVPEALRGQEVTLKLLAARSDYEIPATRSLPSPATLWTADADSVAVEDAVQVTDPEFTSSGDLVALTLAEADLYLQYREWLTDGAATVVAVSTPAEAVAAVGTAAVDNPLGFAAARALAHTRGELAGTVGRPAQTTTDVVLCVNVGGDPTDTDLWAAALEAVESDERCYHLVPLTTLPAVQTMVAEHVAAQSADDLGFYRACWLVGTVTTPIELASGSATIADDGDGNFTVVTATGMNFLTAGVRAGDKFRTNYGVDGDGHETYDAYTVASVVSATTLNLATGPDDEVAVAAHAELWRTPTAAERADQLIAQAATFASDRVCLVWPDEVSFGGAAQGGEFVCAALAGLAGSVAAHQGLRNLGLEGIDDVSRTTTLFPAAQLDRLAAGGVTVVAQTPAGDVYVRSANTTDPSSAGTRNEMVRRNADMIRKAVQAAWAPYVGSGNVVSDLRTQLEAALASLENKLKAPLFVRELGLPLASLRLTGLESVTGQADAVSVTLAVSGLPVPLNVIRVVLPVTV